MSPLAPAWELWADAAMAEPEMIASGEAIRTTAVRLRRRIGMFLYVDVRRGRLAGSEGCMLVTSAASRVNDANGGLMKW